MYTVPGRKVLFEKILRSKAASNDQDVRKSEKFRLIRVKAKGLLGIRDLNLCEFRTKIMNEPEFPSLFVRLAMDGWHARLALRAYGSAYDRPLMATQ